MLRVTIEEKNESGTYKPIDIETIVDMTTVTDTEIVLHVPNACGGETRIVITK